MELNLKYVIVFLIILVHGSNYAQNLIPNPSFEQNTIIEGNSNCFKYSFPHWESLNNTTGCGVHKTYFFDFREYFKRYKTKLNDYYTKWEYDHNCSLYRKIFPNSKVNENYVCFYKHNDENELDNAAIDTTNNYFKAWDGSCFIMSMQSYNKNLFHVKLKNKLEKDSTYHFEMYYRFPRYFKDIFSAGQFGAFFKITNSNDVNNTRLLNNYNYRPQILISELDTNALNYWVKYSCTFIPERDFEYMVIGNHKPFNTTELFSPIQFHIDCLKIVKQEMVKPD